MALRRERIGAHAHDPQVVKFKAGSFKQPKNLNRLSSPLAAEGAPGKGVVQQLKCPEVADGLLTIQPLNMGQHIQDLLGGLILNAT